jgi:tRNA/rRNA methyltransferase
MGIEKIFVVGNRDLPVEEMKQMATHFAAGIVESIQHFDRLDEALANFHYIIGATSRRGSGRGPCVSPREMAELVVEISHCNEVALLFGPEDTGLSNDDLRFCHLLVTIPTSKGMKSVNLSQAVMILCYEIFVGHAGPLEEFTPRMASSEELEGMYEQMKTVLMNIGFLHPQNPDHWMMHIRRFLGRTKLFSKEVKIIRGICRQLDWSMRNKKT